MSGISHSLLLGRWEIDPQDSKAAARYGRVSLEFMADGQLLYTIHEERKDQIMLMIYRIEGDILVTDQPSAPNEVRTRCSLTDDGKLLLELNGEISTYIPAGQDSTS